jgi:radical SAM-linked protein
MKVVHDRLNVEIARGCKRGCRFCEAGFIHRPYRERSPEEIEEILHASLRQTGYEEVSLLSLSAGDYASIQPLLTHLMNRFESKKVAISFPSLRIEAIMGSLAEEVKRVRKTGFTIAPEAGTDRLRKVINKELDERILFQGLEDLFSKGWKHIKLYFMMGLPTEREEDLKGILDLSRRISSLGRKYKIHPNVAVSVSTFVPKPHTPFQWESQIPLEEMKEKLHLLREGLKGNRIQFKWQDPHLSFLEGIFSTGGFSLSKVLVEAFHLGCRFDGWSDQFRYDLWKKAFEKTGVKMDHPTKRKGRDDPLPWSFIETGVSREFLWTEYEKALRGESSPPCVGDCHRCGICGEKIQVKEFATQETCSPVQMDPPGQKKGMKRKVRIKFAKEGEARFLSHLELAHLFYRASRRADLPLSYSEGFHPMPRLVFARALPVGVESQGEIVDMELEGKITPVEVMERLNQTLPPGLKIVEVKEVSLLIPLSSFPQRSVYRISLDRLLSKEETLAKIEGFVKKAEFFLPQERKGKMRSVDVRPLVEEIGVREENSHWGVVLIVREGMGRSAKASEIIGAITGLEGDTLSQCRIVKVE